MSTPEIAFRLLDRSAGETLNAINRACPIEADFTLIFERGPDFFRWPDLVFDRYQYLGAFHGDNLVGYLMLGWFRGWTGSRVETCGYLGDARVLPAYRGHHLTEQLMYAIEDCVPSEARIGFSLVKKGNRPAESLALSTHSTTYVSRPLTDFYALNIPILRPVRSQTDFRVRQAQVSDFGEMARLFSAANAGKLFTPPLTEADLVADLERRPYLPLQVYRVAERGGHIAGMLAACDLEPFHSTRVLNYAPSARVMRAAYNLLTRLNCGATQLPAAGQTLRTLTLTRLGIQGNDPAILQAMLAHLIRERLGQGYHLLTLGLSAGDPLLAAAQGFPLVQRFASTINCISRRSELFDVRGQLPYIDLVMI